MTLERQTSAQHGYRNSIWHFRAEPKIPLQDQILRSLALHEARLFELIDLGAIYGDEIRRRDRLFFEKSHESSVLLRIHSEPRRAPAHEIDWAKHIVFQNDDFLLLDKPAGIPAHPMVDNWVENALNQMERHSGTKLYLTHRLDRATSGLLVLGKTSNFQSEFNQLLKEHQIRKIYRAKTALGSSPEAPFAPPQMLQHWMVRSKFGRKHLSPHPGPGLDECRLTVANLTSTIDGWLLELELHTGRTHQIRAQLAYCGLPIEGDHLYGSPTVHPIDQISLQACALHFLLPSTGKTWSFTLDLPPWWKGNQP